ncbi:hypothetical protein PCASD_07286 [Puccinia coronata f. sp. avenae]|uniref:Uncharacterized protein n=1 Tax=Puccinia coronata f. sp. avenae TaxID=200324 RepID=A0A2N5URI6_9BASI|nr:hypothetical protein PCASD_07286 [Puccinia coronata f. sp. avenae]
MSEHSQPEQQQQQQLDQQQQQQIEHHELDDPTLALDLRIRLLECVFAGSLPTSEAFAKRFSTVDRSGTTSKSLALRLERVLAQLATILDTKPNDAIRRFVQSYDLNEPLLHLPDPTAATKNAGSLGLGEKASLVVEAEPEIVQLERALREIELLDSRGFGGAGKLADANWSQEELAATVADPLQQCISTIDELERRATSMLSQYDSHVNALSEIFVSWDSILTELETDIHALHAAKRTH